MSIRFPLQANAVNKMKIDPAAAIDSLRYFTAQIPGHQVPGWVYTKSSSKASKSKSLNVLDNEAVIKKLCKLHEEGIQYIDEWKKFDIDALVDELLKIKENYGL